MNLEILAFGQKMPSWLQDGITSYQKRFPSYYQLIITDLPLLKRPKTGTLNQILKKESDLMLSHIKSSSHVIALEIGGKQYSSDQMAFRIDKLEQITSHIQFLIGGPEGLSTDCLQKSNEKWSLSNLTLAHPLVRLFLTESLYRSWSINQNHPYHK